MIKQKRFLRRPNQTDIVLSKSNKVKNHQTKHNTIRKNYKPSVLVQAKTHKNLNDLKLKQINFRVSSTFYTDFKLFAINNNVSMLELFRSGFNLAKQTKANHTLEFQKYYLVTYQEIFENQPAQLNSVLWSSNLKEFHIGLFTKQLVDKYTKTHQLSVKRLVVTSFQEVSEEFATFNSLTIEGLQAMNLI